VNPLGFDKQGPYALTVDEGSAAEQAQLLLPDSIVVGAFHHVSAVTLEDPHAPSVDTDVLVLGDVREATELVQDLAGTVPGVRGVYGGRLRNAHQVEAFTANLISVNRRYKAHAGVRVTDLWSSRERASRPLPCHTPPVHTFQRWPTGLRPSRIGRSRTHSRGASPKTSRASASLIELSSPSRTGST